MKQTCNVCGHEFDAAEAQCPHCGNPGEQPAGTPPSAESAPSCPPVPDLTEAQPAAGTPVPPPAPPAAADEMPPAAIPEPPAPHRRRNPWPWIALGLLALLVAGAAVWYHQITEGRPYDYDDTPYAEPAETAVPMPEKEPDGTLEEELALPADSAAIAAPADTAAIAPEPHNLVLSGTLVLESDPSVTCDVLIHANIEADGDVTGSAAWNNTSSGLTGLYNANTEHLVLYEETGNRYEGYITSGYSYNGTYSDENGTWHFTLNVN